MESGLHLFKGDEHLGELGRVINLPILLWGEVAAGSCQSDAGATSSPRQQMCVLISQWVNFYQTKIQGVRAQASCLTCATRYYQNCDDFSHTAFDQGGTKNSPQLPRDGA